MTRRLLFPLVFLSTMFCSLAFAQSAPPATPVDPSSLVTQLLGFITTGHGMAAVGVALMLLVWGVQTFLGQDSFFKTGLGENILVHGVPAVLYVGAALASGASISVNLLIAAVAAGFAAKGVLAHLRSVKAPPAVANAAKVSIVLLAIIGLAGCGGPQAPGSGGACVQSVLQTHITVQNVATTLGDAVENALATGVAGIPAAGLEILTGLGVPVALDLLSCAIDLIEGKPAVPPDAGAKVGSTGETRAQRIAAFREFVAQQRQAKAAGK
jgi:hypothetical protein